LHEGDWEVVVPKESVTGPSDGWEKPGINVPSPGTIASYRKGQYHVHETKTEWRVHLDRYDPKTHPLLHLVDDAPLLLMIGGTFLTLIMETRSTKDDDTSRILEEQKAGWQVLVMIGISLMFVGFLIIADPLVTFKGIIHIVIPVLVTGLGIVIIRRGLSFGPVKVVSRGVYFSDCVS
jgi:hypothetical protein